MRAAEKLEESIPDRIPRVRNRPLARIDIVVGAKVLRKEEKRTVSLNNKSRYNRRKITMSM